MLRAILFMMGITIGWEVTCVNRKQHVNGNLGFHHHSDMVHVVCAPHHGRRDRGDQIARLRIANLVLCHERDMAH